MPRPGRSVSVSPSLTRSIQHPPHPRPPLLGPGFNSRLSGWGQAWCAAPSLGLFAHLRMGGHRDRRAGGRLAVLKVATMGGPGDHTHMPCLRLRVGSWRAEPFTFSSCRAVRTHLKDLSLVTAAVLTGEGGSPRKLPVAVAQPLDGLITRRHPRRPEGL